MTFKHFSDSVYMSVLLLVLLAGSILIHVLVLMRYYHPGLIMVSFLTFTMFLAWLYSSYRIKRLPAYYPGENPWRLAFRKSPDVWRFSVGFVILYALINLFMSLSADSGPGFFNTDIPFHKLRGLSGFWMAFFALASLAQVTVKRLIKRKNRMEKGCDKK